MDYLHGALRPTRGAAIAVARLLPGTREVRFAGVGQHRAALIQSDGAARQMISHPGTVGHAVRKVRAIHLRLAGRRDGVVILGWDSQPHIF